VAKKMMRRVLFISILVGASSLPLFPQQPTTPVPAEEPPPVLTVPRDYRYNSRGRRDPFVNPVPKPKEAAPPAVVVPAVRPPGLRGVLVNDAQVAGVVTSKEPSMNVVIIAAPGARTPYFARVGEQLYDAVVKSITLDTVTFTVTGPGGDSKTPRDIVRRVRPNPGEDK
jgi:hypothetical protein